jgi:hypothetical protein
MDVKEFVDETLKQVTEAVEVNRSTFINGGIGMWRSSKAKYVFPPGRLGYLR